MDITRYSQDIQELYEQHEQYLKHSDLKDLEVLERLRLKAMESGDDELIGYVHHSLAFSEYFITGNYDAFLKNLHLAAEALLRCEDQSEIMHVHYLVGLDSLNKGLHDLAYYNLHKARQIAQKEGKETSAAILEESVGHVLSRIGIYDEARTAFELSLEGIAQDPSHPHYYNNMAGCHINIADVCLELGLFDEAERRYEEVQAFMHDNPEFFQLNAELNLVMIGARIAIQKNDNVRMEQGVEETLKLLKKIVQLSNHIDGIQKLMNELIAAEKYHEAGILIAALEERQETDDAYNTQRVLAEARIAHCQATDQQEALLESYLDQDRINAHIKEGEALTNKYVRDLISLTNSMYIEKENQQRERTRLIKIVETDALTGLSNRYASDLHFTHAFERAYAQQSLLAVCFLDLDNLKRWNDTYGHQAGDELIVSIANALKKLMDDPRVFSSRYGGDEFIILCEDMSNQEIQETLEKIPDLTNAEFSVGVFNAIPQGKMKTWDFLQAADRELFSIKRARKAQQTTSNISISSEVLSLSERTKSATIDNPKD